MHPKQIFEPSYFVIALIREWFYIASSKVNSVQEAFMWFARFQILVEGEQKKRYNDVFKSGGNILV